MKLLKIGKSPSCNIKLPSPRVSSLHAEMLILDSGEIFIEDKNSLNGTFIGNEKITPNVEVQVHRGDYIRFADTELNWGMVPAPERNNNYKTIINIGTHHRNDLIISGTFASRFHAVLKIAKDGKAYIRDNQSQNGTIVNGSKIDSNKDIRIKSGDSVICGNTDITEELKPYLPNPWGWVKKAAIGIAAMAVLAGVVFAIMSIIGGSNNYRQAVVYVRACYHYNVELDDNPMPELWNASFSLDDDESRFRYQATAFIIDREGRMATNRHVAVPWAKEYRDESTDNQIKQMVHNYLSQIFPVNEVTTEAELDRLMSSPYGKLVYNYALSLSSRPSEILRNINTTLRRIKNSPLTISGEMDFITVGYPGRYYTHEDEFERCFVLTASDTDEKDIALLQLNTKRTPADIKDIFDVSKFRLDKIEPLKEQYYTIGYPRGIEWALDTNTHSLEPEIREVKCGKVPSKYTFEFQGESLHGASGSPIFDKKGRLVGVLWGGWAAGTTFGHACQARYLKEMYEQEVGL